MWENRINRKGLSLCYYPTTVMLVSDNSHYALSLNALSEGSFIYQRFQQAQDAVYNVLNTIRDILPSSAACWYEKTEDQVCAFSLALQAIMNRRTHQSRFAEPSVVLFDATSVNNWQQACEQLQGSAVQRVLQGGSTEQVLEAFNKGLIDYAMHQHDKPSALNQLQQQYFQNRLQNLLPGLQQHTPWLTDLAFAEYWQQLQQQYQITEYYYATDPAGFICISGTGQTYRVIVYEDSDIDGQIDCAKDLMAPDSIINKMQSRQSIPYFATQDGYYSKSIVAPQSCLYSAMWVQGERDYYCAIAALED